jgi:RNA polymerase sigma-70 factor (ECF subfamily)
LDVPGRVIEACKRGEPEAFEELIALTHREVYSLSMRLMGNPDDAAEATQETYLKLLRSIRSYRGEAKFSTWLYQVTSSVAVSMLRRRARQRLDVPLDDRDWATLAAPSSGEPAEQIEQRQMSQRLEAALAELPAGYRTVVVMKDVYGFHLEEIGKQLGISEGAAKVRLFRARQRLKERLYEDGPASYGPPVRRAPEKRLETGDGM